MAQLKSTSVTGNLSVTGQIVEGGEPLSEKYALKGEGEVATETAAGLMSADDKKKLNGIAAGANNYTLPAATSETLGGVKLVYNSNDKSLIIKTS